MAKILGIELAPMNIPLNRRLQTASVLHWVCCFLFSTFGTLVLTIYLFLFTSLWWLSGLYMLWFAYDYKICQQGGRRVQWVRKWKVWKYYADYFPISLTKTCEIPPNKNYLFAFHPHGVLSCGVFCNFGTEGTEFSNVFPGIRPFLLTLTGLFWFPLFREYFLCTGACDASKESFHHIFTKEGKGNAAVLVVGGAKEALCANPAKYIVLLKNRKGFIRIAMRYGVDLVPVYSFGETDIFTQTDNPQGSWVRWLQDKMVKVLGFSTPLFHGRGVFNYTFGILPFRKPINTVVGTPIPVEKCENVSDAKVDELHAKYIESLSNLFDSYKEKFGIHKDVRLEII